MKENGKQEKKEARKEALKNIWKENKELIAQAGIAILGFIGVVVDVVGVYIDHNKTKEEQNFDRAFVHDRTNDLYWYLKEPLTNEENKDLIRRENNGESRYEALRHMHKI